MLYLSDIVVSPGIAKRLYHVKKLETPIFYIITLHRRIYAVTKQTWKNPYSTFYAPAPDTNLLINSIGPNEGITFKKKDNSYLCRVYKNNKVIQSESNRPIDSLALCAILIFVDNSK